MYILFAEEKRQILIFIVFLYCLVILKVSISFGALVNTSDLFSFFLIKYYYYLISILFSLEVGNCLTLRAQFILFDVAMCRPGVESKPPISNSFPSQ